MFKFIEFLFPEGLELGEFFLVGLINVLDLSIMFVLEFVGLGRVEDALELFYLETGSLCLQELTLFGRFFHEGG